jgi:hypothetical protein
MELEECKADASSLNSSAEITTSPESTGQVVVSSTANTGGFGGSASSSVASTVASTGIGGNGGAGGM